MSTSVSLKHISSVSSAALRQAHWRAGEYLLAGEPDGQPHNPLRIEAAPGARWESFDPLEGYDPAPPKTRLRAGMLHLDLLHAHNELRGGTLLPMQRLVASHGLLGLEHRYFDLSRPLLPEGKAHVAPDAVLMPGGELLEVSEAEGRALMGGVDNIAELVGSSEGKRWRRLISATGLPSTVDPASIASPDELRFHATGEYGPDPLPDRPGPVSYPVLKDAFGAVLVADLSQPAGVRVLATREPLWAWNHQLSAFRHVADSLNAGDSTDDPDELAREILEAELAGVALGFGGDGETGLRYLCRDLLQAAYLMVVLDHQAGIGLGPCATEGCPYYAREGEQSSGHCSRECASRHSTRESRRRKRAKNDTTLTPP